MTAFNPVGFTKAHIVDLETITTSPAAGAVPKADGAGKIDNGWLNTGSGNGLDADLLDGNHASAFALLSGANFSGNVTVTGAQLRAAHSSGAAFSIETISEGFTNMQRTTPSGQCTIAFDPIPLDGTALSEVRLFRNVNTTGSAELTFYRGNGTGTVQHKIRSKGGPTYFCLTDGDFGVGTNSPTAKFDVNGDTFRLRSSRTPASANAAGNAGDICWDSNYIYVCIATNTWRRIAHESWT